MADKSLLSRAKDVLATEARGLDALADNLTPAFADAVALLKSCKGRVIFSGMGKSGHIGAKIAATMASTGTPAFSIHPGEASHGDLGMVADGDILVLLSNSGNSSELRDLVIHAKRQKLPIIGISRDSNSMVGEAASVFLQLPNVEEACALRLAPTTSTTMTLALGDALCVVLMQEKGFEPSDFHKFHPGGKLGLDLIQVKSLMRSSDQVPQCHVDLSMGEVLDKMNMGQLGFIALMDAEGLAGVITDGDVRRHSSLPLIEQRPRDLMSTNPIHVVDKDLAVDALKLMNSRAVTSLIVRDASSSFVGLLHIHELLRAGLG